LSFTLTTKFAANDIALPKVMNNIIASTAYSYLWSTEGFDMYEINQTRSILFTGEQGRKIRTAYLPIMWNENGFSNH
jgi:hypothetical protein